MDYDLYPEVKFRLLQEYVRELLHKSETQRKEREKRLLKEMDNCLIQSIAPDNYENWEKIKKQLVESRHLDDEHKPTAIAFWRDGRNKVFYDEDPIKFDREEQARDQRDGLDNYIGIIML